MPLIKTRRLSSTDGGLSPRRQATVVAPCTHLEGSIEAEGPVVIAGTLHGSIVSDDKVLIEPGGLVRGSVVARYADIAGVFDGEMRAQEIVITATGEATGRLTYDALSVDPGAWLDTELAPVQQSERTVLDVIVSDGGAPVPA